MTRNLCDSVYMIIYNFTMLRNYLTLTSKL